MEDLYKNLHILSHLLERVIIPESLAKSGDHTLSKPQYETLLFVQNHPNARPGELAKAFGISAPTATTLLQRLEKKGLLGKSPADDDQRSIVLRLTPAGERLLAVAEQTRQAMLSRLVDLTPPEQQRDLARGLEALLRAAAQTRDHNQLCLQCGNAHNDACVLAHSR